VSPLVPAAVAAACVALGAVGLRMLRDAGPAARLLLDEANRTGDRAGLPLWLRAVERISGHLAPWMVGLLGPARLDAIDERLNAAGRPLTVERYVGRKGLSTLLGGVAAVVLLVQGQPVTALLVAGVGWTWMDMRLTSVARRRQARVDRELPDFLDILAVTVGAGLAFRPALQRVAEALGGPVGEEILTTLRQMELGASRRDAFESLRDRNQSEALSQFVTALLQAEELGAPLSDTLTELAREMRRDAAQKARRRAARATPRVSLAVTLLVLPGAMILIVASLFVGAGMQIGGFGG
jgi:tight adherence protein C